MEIIPLSIIQIQIVVPVNILQIQIVPDCEITLRKFFKIFLSISMGPISTKLRTKHFEGEGDSILFN